MSRALRDAGETERRPSRCDLVAVRDGAGARSRRSCARARGRGRTRRRRRCRRARAPRARASRAARRGSRRDRRGSGRRGARRCIANGRVASAASRSRAWAMHAVDPALAPALADRSRPRRAAARYSTSWRCPSASTASSERVLRREVAVEGLVREARLPARCRAPAGRCRRSRRMTDERGVDQPPHLGRVGCPALGDAPGRPARLPRQAGTTFCTPRTLFRPTTGVNNRAPRIRSRDQSCPHRWVDLAARHADSAMSWRHWAAGVAGVVRR